MWNTVTGRCLNLTQIKAADKLRSSILPFLTLFYANQIYDVYSKRSATEGGHDDRYLCHGGNYHGVECAGKNAKRNNLYLPKKGKDEQSQVKARKDLSMYNDTPILMLHIAAVNIFDIKIAQYRSLPWYKQATIT